MPTITVDVENTEQTITRRVALDVVYDLIHAFGLPYNIRILFPNTTDPEDLPIVVPSQDVDDTLASMNIVVKVNETFSNMGVSETTVSADETQPLFRDKTLNVVIAPVYVRKEMNFSIKLRFPDRNSALTQMSDLRRNIGLRQDGLFHDVKYDYILPKVNVVILAEIFRLRESLAGYGEELRDWYAASFSDQMTTLFNSDGSQGSLTKQEFQTGILGTYNFDITPDDPEKADDLTNELIIDYKMKYDKIISTTMRYPILVHNQPISSKFYDNTLPFDFSDAIQLPSRFRLRSDKFSNNRFITGFSKGAPIPTFLTWTPPTVPNAVEGLLRVMVMVNPDDLRECFSLQDMGELKLAEHMIEYMKSEYTNLTTHRKSVIFVALYENGNMLGSDKLEIDSELGLRTTFDMDLRKEYHVWVGILTDLEFLDERAVDRVRANGDILSHLIRGIDFEFPETHMPKRLSGGHVPKKEFERVVDEINSKKVPIKGVPVHPNLRIGNFIFVV